MPKLRVLPSQLANMIAAGEVVNRPASVVKELMENAIDAGATEVNVIISDFGRTLIQVIDNGCGMSPSDAVLCFERHSTSKIASASDLEQILTYGFRGEALASIAAVSEVTLVTRRECDDVATKVQIAGTNEVKTSSVAAPVGSNFSVRNIFFNTPARRKFLKSDSAELRNIISEFMHVAITRPNIAFSFSSNGRDLYVLKKAKTLKQRVMELMGSTLVSELIDIEADTSMAQIAGFIGRPDTAKKTAGNQFFFVNGRYFRSAYLHKAIMKAYEDMVPEGSVPSYFLFLKCDPKAVDINIHPTKSEVKFENEPVLFQILCAVVKENLGKSSFGASLNFESGDDIPQIGRSFDEYKTNISIPKSVIDYNFNPFESADNQIDSFENERHSYNTEAYITKSQNYGKLFEEREVLSTKTLIIKNGKYILAPAASGIMVVNTSRAYERLLYDNALKALNESAQVSQTSLFPVKVALNPEQILLFEEHKELLTKLGFGIELNECAVTVNAIPQGFSPESGKVTELVGDLMYILSDEVSTVSELMNQRTAQKIATLGASHNSAISSAIEAQNLLDTLFASSNSEYTSSGRRIVAIVPIEEVEKLFN